MGAVNLSKIIGDHMNIFYFFDKTTRLKHKTSSERCCVLVSHTNKSSCAKKQAGFTLIEIMVAVSIFALVMVVAIGAVLSIVSANKKSLAVSSVLSNFNSALESMVRDLRTGYDYRCGNTGGDCSDGEEGESITFFSTQSNQDVTYGVEGDAITKEVNGNTQYLTSKDVIVDDLRFYVSGTDTAILDSDYKQPRIIITLKGTYNGLGKLTEFHLQTMVSQRRIDI